MRFTKIFESIWSDGLGGYWQGRSLNTIIISFQIISLIIIGLREMIKNIRFEKSLLIILISTFIYIVWIYFSQNVIYKSRHILPVLPFIFLILNFGYEYLLSKNHGASTCSNLSSTLALKNITEKYGGKYFSSAVGEINVVQVMKEKKCLIGGEGNGGVIYPMTHYGRDSLIGIGLIISLLVERNISLSELKKKIGSVN